MRNRSVAFYNRLQQDDLLIAEIIDLEFQNGLAYRWVTANDPLTYTLSGVATRYSPFPGSGGMAQEQIKLGVSNTNFMISNSGDALQALLLSKDFALGSVKMGWIFTDTPNLGRMDFYIGKVGDFSWDRLQITGQTRNLWKSLNIQWPYYTFQDKCAWRFGSAGCGFNTSSVTLAVDSINVTSSTPYVFLVKSGVLSTVYANGRFDFGRATVTAGANSGFIRAIMAHSGDQLTFSHPFPYADLTGAKLSIFPGCRKRLLDDCHSLYNNNTNAIAFPATPKMADAF